MSLAKDVSQIHERLLCGDQMIYDHIFFQTKLIKVFIIVQRKLKII